jgi:hypothetical protein
MSRVARLSPVPTARPRPRPAHADRAAALVPAGVPAACSRSSGTSSAPQSITSSSADAWSALRPPGGHLPIYFGGALLDAAAYADLIRLVHDQVGEDIDSYRARVAA